MLQLGFGSVPKSLRELFPMDPKGEIHLTIGSQTFQLRSSLLLRESEFFKRHCDQTHFVVEHPKDVWLLTQVLLHLSILSCFYGKTITIGPESIPDAFAICHYFGITSLLRTLRQHILACPSSLPLLQRLILAITYQESTIFESCHRELEAQGFRLLESPPAELLALDEEVFKILIQSHESARKTGKAPYSLEFVCDLIEQYADHRAPELICQLLDKASMTPETYERTVLQRVRKWAEWDEDLKRQLPEFENEFSRLVNLQLERQNQQHLAQIEDLHAQYHKLQSAFTNFLSDIEAMKADFQAKTRELQLQQEELTRLKRENSDLAEQLRVLSAENHALRQALSEATQHPRRETYPLPSSQAHLHAKAQEQGSLKNIIEAKKQGNNFGHNPAEASLSVSKADSPGQEERKSLKEVSSKKPIKKLHPANNRSAREKSAKAPPDIEEKLDEGESLIGRLESEIRPAQRPIATLNESPDLSHTELRMQVSNEIQLVALQVAKQKPKEPSSGLKANDSEGKRLVLPSTLRTKMPTQLDSEC